MRDMLTIYADPASQVGDDIMAEIDVPMKELVGGPLPAMNEVAG